MMLNRKRAIVESAGQDSLHRRNLDSAMDAFASEFVRRDFAWVTHE
jgi:hypothetical protein